MPSPPGAPPLSEGQKAVIVKLGNADLPFGGLFRTGLSADEEFALKRDGLVAWSIQPGCMGAVCRLTIDGLAVRQILIEERVKG